MLLTFILALAAAGESPAQSAVAEPAKPKLICRRETPIGSLIATRKICLTQPEWEKRFADGNEEARKQAYDNMGRPSCNGSSSC